MTNCIAIPAATVKLGRILAPVDFTEHCRLAALDAEALARRFGAELVLLHAVAPIGIPLSPAEALAYANAAELTVERVAQMTPVLEGFLAGELRGVPTRRVLVETDAVRGILDYANQRSCDLIVMPTHGHGALHRLVLGSVTGEVLRHAPCPVWTGCHFEQPHAVFRSVLCAVDFHSQNHALVHWAAGFAREFGAELHLVHAIPTSTVHSGPIYFDPDWHEQVAHEARHRMSELAAETGADAQSHVPLGEIPAAIAETAGAAHADLVVIGRGPKAYSVIRAAPCPVVVV